MATPSESVLLRKYHQALDACRTLGSAKPDLAIKAGYRALMHARQISPKEEASTMAHIAYLLARQKRGEEADALIEQSIRLASTLRDPQLLARILGSRAAMYNNRGKPLDALKYYVRALRHIDQGTTMHAGILDGLGQALWQLGRAAEASEYLLHAIEIYEAQSGRIVSAASYGTIASIYIELGDWKRSRQALRKAEFAAKRSHDLINLCSVKLAFGELESLSGRPAAALPFLRSAERMALRLGTARDYASAISQQSECARLLKKPREALALADRALAATNPEDAPLVRAALVRKADALFDLKNYDEAAALFQEAAKLTLGNTDLLLELSRKIAACFAATKNYRQAYFELGKNIGGSVESRKKQLSRVLVVERELAKLRTNAARNRIFREQEEARRIALRDSLREAARLRKEMIQLEQRTEPRSYKTATAGNKTPQALRDLAIRHPTLTPTELRICDLLSKALSTKEIASLTERSVRTVEWHRACIRKKLNLRRGKSLELLLL